jgi:hypothetical protein
LTISASRGIKKSTTTSICFPTISRGNLANQLEAPKSLALGIAMALKRADQGCVLAVAERFGVQADVHVERAHMRHVLVGQQQPREPRHR